MPAEPFDTTQDRLGEALSGSQSDSPGAAAASKKHAVRVCLALFVLFCSAISSAAQQSSSPLLPFLDRPINIEAPTVLCIDDKPTTGGQPSRSAYARAAANGFRSILTLRAASDGVDAARERFMVEQANLRYFNIPAIGKLPERNRVDEFLAIAREPKNQPVLINCAFAERVAPFMMIFRIGEQGWPEKRALEEAASSGLNEEALRKFARAYFAAGKKPGS